MARVVLLGVVPELRDRLLGALARCGADGSVADDRHAALRALAVERPDAIVAALDAPGTSGLGVLLAARELHPAARRVLVVDRRGPLADAALASGIADRIVSGPASEPRLQALAEWLSDLASHAPRRKSA